MSVRTIAVIVGIEKYSDPQAPELPTAGPDAVRVALAAQQRLGVQGDDTYLFLSLTSRSDDDRRGFQALRDDLKAGTHVSDVSESCTQAAIDTFWRRDLRALQAADEIRLFFYWCGHGFSDARTGVPYLLCSDWSATLATRLMNRIELLDTLHSEHYLNCRSQLLFFDACANNIPAGAIPGNTEGTWNDGISQLCISSAARGQYAHSDGKSGRFTRVLLQSLNELDAWPEPETLTTRLKERLKSAGHSSSVVRFRSQQLDEEAWRAANPARDALVALLKAIDIAPTEYRPLYLWVVSSLSSEAARGGGVTIEQMVDDLWNANGFAASAMAAYGIVEFVLLIRRAFPAKTETLDKWTDTKSYVAPADLAQARAALKEKQNALFLIVELHESKTEDRTGEIVKFQTRLMQFNRTRSVSSWSGGETLVASWDDAKKAIGPVIERAQQIADETNAPLTVEFVTNVYDIDPHLIKLPDDAMLGDRNPVIMRSRAQRSRDMLDSWLERANAIRQGRIAAQIHPVSTAEPKLAQCRVLFVRHALPPGSRPKHPQPLSPEWRLVRRAIDAGVPFMCWPIRAPAGNSFSRFETELAAWIENSKTLDELPRRIKGDRSEGGLAADVNLFWDDPLPTWQLRELRVG